jgi:hypothetical protein
MIVVIGLPAYAGSAAGEGSAGGLAVDVAAGARARGGVVELVGKVGDDGAGDAVVVALGRLGVGHAALLRDPARPTPLLSVLAVAAGPQAADRAADVVAGDSVADPAAALAADRGEDEPRIDVQLLPADPAARPGLEAGDISLALRYLAETRVVVLAEPLPELAVAAVVEGAAFAGARLVVLVPPGATPPPLPPEATVRSVAWWGPSRPGSMPGRNRPRRSRRRSGPRAGSLSPTEDSRLPRAGLGRRATPASGDTPGPSFHVECPPWIVLPRDFDSKDHPPLRPVRTLRGQARWIDPPLSP